MFREFCCGFMTRSLPSEFWCTSERNLERAFNQEQTCTLFLVKAIWLHAIWLISAQLRVFISLKIIRKIGLEISSTSCLIFGGRMAISRRVFCKYEMSYAHWSTKDISIFFRVYIVDTNKEKFRHFRIEVFLTLKNAANFLHIYTSNIYSSLKFILFTKTISEWIYRLSEDQSLTPSKRTTGHYSISTPCLLGSAKETRGQSQLL